MCLRVSKDFINRTNRNSAYALCSTYSWAQEFTNSNVCRTNGPGNFLITKKCSANNSSMDLLIKNSHWPSMYTLSRGVALFFKKLWSTNQCCASHQAIFLNKGHIISIGKKYHFRCDKRVNFDTRTNRFKEDLRSKKASLLAL